MDLSGKNTQRSRELMSTNISAQVLQQGNEEIPEEEEYDRYRDNPDLLGEAMPKAARLFSFDW